MKINNGKLTGTVIKILMLDNYTLDLKTIYRLVQKQVPDASEASIRATLYSLVDRGYVEKPKRGYFKATAACLAGAVDGNVSKNTVKYACTSSGENK